MLIAYSLALSASAMSFCGMTPMIARSRKNAIGPNADSAAANY
jgi:hypothetical protein